MCLFLSSLILEYICDTYTEMLGERLEETSLGYNPCARYSFHVVVVLRRKKEIGYLRSKKLSDTLDRTFLVELHLQSTFDQLFLFLCCCEKYFRYLLRSSK